MAVGSQCPTPQCWLCTSWANFRKCGCALVRRSRCVYLVLPPSSATYVLRGNEPSQVIPPCKGPASVNNTVQLPYLWRSIWFGRSLGCWSRWSWNRLYIRNASSWSIFLWLMSFWALMRTAATGLRSCMYFFFFYS